MQPPAVCAAVTSAAVLVGCWLRQLRAQIEYHKWWRKLAITWAMCEEVAQDNLFCRRLLVREHGSR